MFAGEVSWTLSCPGMCDIEGGAPYGEYGEMLHSVPPGAACSLKMEDSYGDGWNGFEWSAAGWAPLEFSFSDGYDSTEYFTAPAVAMPAPTPPPPPPPFTAPSPPSPPVPCSYSWDASWPEAAVTVSEGDFAYEVSWTLSCVGMCDVIEGGAPHDGMISVPPGAACSLKMEDSYGDGWNGAVWWSGFADEAGYTLEDGSIETISFTSPAELGQCIVNGPCVCSSNYPGDSCNADPVDYYDYSGMGMDGMPSPSPLSGDYGGYGGYMGDYGGYGSYSSYDFNMGGYGNFETCHVEFGQPMMLNVVLFGVEGGDECPYDYLEVNGVTYCGDQPASNAGSGPMQMQFLDGQITSSLDWSSDDWFTGVGFKICTSPAPPSPPSPPNMWLEGAKCPSGSFPAPYYGAYDMPSPSPMPWPSPGSAAAPGWPSPGSEAGQNGEVACENQGFGESECNAIGCCQFDGCSPPDCSPSCSSASGPGPCSAAGVTAWSNGDDSAWAGQAPTVTNTPSGRRLDLDSSGTVFDGTWLYESKEEAKQACAAGCVAANENADMMADMMADGAYADMYGDMPRCAYAELYYDGEYYDGVYTSCNLKTDACGDYSTDDSWNIEYYSLWVAPPPAPAPPPPPSLPDNYLHSTVTVTDQWADDLSWTLACEGFANFTVETEFWFTGYAETHAYPPGTQCNLHMHVSNWYDPFMYGWNGVTWSAYGWGSTAGPFSLDYEDCAGIMGLCTGTESFIVGAPPSPPLSAAAEAGAALAALERLELEQEPLGAACQTEGGDWIESAVSVTPGSWAGEVSWTLSCPGMCDI